jgi:hypothetical protein
MTNLFNRIKKLFLLLLAYIPTPLPIGMTEHEKWAGSVIALTNLPDNDSTRFALASTIPHQKAENFLVPKIKMARLLEKSAANQIAGAVMHELKDKQLKRAAEEAAKQAAEEAAKQAEVPAPEAAQLEHRHIEV